MEVATVQVPAMMMLNRIRNGETILTEQLKRLNVYTVSYRVDAKWNKGQLTYLVIKVNNRQKDPMASEVTTALVWSDGSKLQVRFDSEQFKIPFSLKATIYKFQVRMEQELTGVQTTLGWS